MTKTFFTGTVLLVAGFSIATSVEFRTWNKLDAEHTTLAQEYARLSSDNLARFHRAMLASTPKITGRSKYEELHKLRAEAVRLRDKTNEMANLETEQWNLQTQLAKIPVPYEKLSLEDQYILRGFHLSDAIGNITEAVNKYTDSHHGRLPPDFDELAASGLLKVTNFPGGLSLADFEMLPPGVRGPAGQQLIFRNRVPMPKPNAPADWVYASLRQGCVTTSEDLTAPGPHTF